MPVTVSSGNEWFIHLTTRKACTVTGRGSPKRAEVHSTGKPVRWRCVADKTILVLRYEDITELDDVIVVEWE